MKSKLVKYSFLFLSTALMVSLFAFSNVDKKSVAAATEEKGIKFIEQDWGKALEQAKTEKKLVFLDIYATWCGPCKMLKKHTFSDAAVGEFFNKQFINISVDGEKGVGPELARKFGIQGYPALIVTDEKGNVLLQTAGYVDADYLMSFAKEALKRKS